MSIFWEIVLIWLATEPIDEFNIGSGNGLVPSGTKPLPESV